MATVDEHFTHLMQAYSHLSNDAAAKREIAAKLLTLLDEESERVNYDAPDTDGDDE